MGTPEERLGGARDVDRGSFLAGVLSFAGVEAVFGVDLVCRGMRGCSSEEGDTVREPEKSELDSGEEEEEEDAEGRVLPRLGV